MKSKTVLITGASGLLGRAVLRVFEQSGWNATGTGFTRADPPRILKVDITDFTTFEALINELNPSVIVHSAAERSHFVAGDAEKTAQVERLNVQVPEFLGKITREKGILLIYISTDYVFDGKNPPYYPDSKTNPLNPYGVSKLKGEQAALGANPQSAISLRVPVLYGEARNDESAVNIIVDEVMNKSQKSSISVDNVAARYPTEVADVGRVLRDISDLYLTNPQAFKFPEILQFSAEQKMTKYEMSLKLAEILGVPTDHLVKMDTIDENTAVNRPIDSHLDTGRLKELGINVQGVDFVNWWRRYLGAYRH